MHRWDLAASEEAFEEDSVVGSVVVEAATSMIADLMAAREVSDTAHQMERQLGQDLVALAANEEGMQTTNQFSNEVVATETAMDRPAAGATMIMTAVADDTEHVTDLADDTEHITVSFTALSGKADTSLGKTDLRRHFSIATAFDKRHGDIEERPFSLSYSACICVILG